MSYPFVHARYDYGTRKGPALAFVIHVAEGGGTVGYLANDPARGVSVHYVIDVKGKTTQMLLESHASGSINPQELRTTDDADGFFGVTAAKAALGTWWRDPNSAVISLEIEGFAATGPSKIQQDALAALVADVRSRYPQIALLGHRDFTSTKACPGKLIPWARLGGHGPAPEGEPVQTTYTHDPSVARTGTLTVTGTGHYYQLLKDSSLHGPIDPTNAAWINRPAYGPVKLDPPIPGGPAGQDRSTAYIIGRDAAALLAFSVTFTPDPNPNDARQAGYEDARTKLIAAAEAL